MSAAAVAWNDMGMDRGWIGEGIASGRLNDESCSRFFVHLDAVEAGEAPRRQTRLLGMIARIKTDRIEAEPVWKAKEEAEDERVKAARIEAKAEGAARFAVV